MYVDTSSLKKAYHSAGETLIDILHNLILARALALVYAGENSSKTTLIGNGHGAGARMRCRVSWRQRRDAI